MAYRFRVSAVRRRGSQRKLRVTRFAAGSEQRKFPVYPSRVLRVGWQSHPSKRSEVPLGFTQPEGRGDR